MTNIFYGHQQLFQDIPNNKHASYEQTTHNSYQGFVGSMP